MYRDLWWYKLGLELGKRYIRDDTKSIEDNMYNETIEVELKLEVELCNGLKACYTWLEN